MAGAPDHSASSARRGSALAGLSGVVLAACGGGASGGQTDGPRLPAGTTAGGASYRVSVSAGAEPDGANGRLASAWCPRVDLIYPGGRRTHGAVGCRTIRPDVPTGGFTIFCRHPAETFVLLLSTRSTRAVSVAARAGRTVGLTA